MGKDKLNKVMCEKKNLLFHEIFSIVVSPSTLSSMFLFCVCAFLFVNDTSYRFIVTTKYIHPESIPTFFQRKLVLISINIHKMKWALTLQVMAP